MKEKILCAGGVAIGALAFRQGVEYFISSAEWPQYAKDAGLFLFQNPVMWTIWGGMGALIGWLVPDSFMDRPRDLNFSEISSQERGSAKIVALLSLATVLTIGAGAAATEIGQPATDVILGLPKGGERIVSGLWSSLTNPGR